MFLIWDKKTTKSLQNSIRFLRRVWAPVSIANMCAKNNSRGTRHMNTQSVAVSVSVSVCVSIDLRNLSNVS